MGLLFQPFDPGLDLRLGRAVQRLSCLPVDFGILCLELGIGLVDAAAAGGGEKDDGLALESVSLDEGVDDRGGGVPPDGEADVNDIIGVGVLQVLHDGRTGAAVLLCRAGAQSTNRQE